MPAALICAAEGVDLAAELGGTALWRGEFRHSVCSSDEAARERVAQGVDVVVIDRDLGWAAALVRWMRGEPGAAHVPVLVASRGPAPDRDRELASAGVHAVLRLPAGSEWDGCLARLLPLSVRGEVRVPVHFRVSARIAATEEARTGVAVDVSETGMLLESPDLGVGDELHLAFQIPGQSRLTSARARVVRRAAAGRWGLELAFPREDFVGQIRALAASLAGEGDGAGETGRSRS